MSLAVGGRINSKLSFKSYIGAQNMGIPSTFHKIEDCIKNLDWNPLVHAKRGDKNFDDFKDMWLREIVGYKINVDLLHSVLAIWNSSPAGSYRSGSRGRGCGSGGGLGWDNLWLDLSSHVLRGQFFCPFRRVSFTCCSCSCKGDRSSGLYRFCQWHIFRYFRLEKSSRFIAKNLRSFNLRTIVAPNCLQVRIFFVRKMKRTQVNKYEIY